jgi:RNase H-like domain found in reverse transcriptase/Reverse transcriptase (RNA-dependent DNA polymerase)
MYFAECDEAEDQKALREVLLEYRDVFRPTTSIVRGSDFPIKL